MDIERFGKLKKEDKEEDLEHQEDEPISIEAVMNKIKLAENKIEKLVVTGQKKIDNLEKEYQLPAGIIDSICKEIDLKDKLEEFSYESELLFYEMEEILSEFLPESKNAEDLPIKKGEEFSPEDELKKILKAPKLERKKLLREYKEKLIYQKEGLAVIQKEIIAKIRDNPDATLSELYEMVKDFASKYGLSSEQKMIARNLLFEYNKKHSFVRMEREKYPNDADLFTVVFGRPPKGEIEIIQGPITLYFRCKDPEDYALIHSGAFMSLKTPSEEQIKEASMSGGVSTSGALIPGLRNSIIAENSSVVHGDYRKILDHEEQHAIKKLFGDKISMRMPWARIVYAENDEERLLAVRDYIRTEREFQADEKARDEILAYFVGSGYKKDKIIDILTTTKEDHGLYDYLSGKNQALIDLFTNKFGVEFEATIKKEIERVFVTEYKELIKKGTEAFETLNEIGYSKEQVMAILIHEPLSRWEKVVKRIKDNYRAKSI